ncbi:MAG TPA: type I methionyl aminopeptidase [Chloroflexota bacterium]|nr:type I methionyl aminopeptidase [Chloroflexota bacterium]
MTRVPVHSNEDLQSMRRAGAVIGNTLVLVAQAVEPGVTTAELDRIAARSIEEAGAIASFPLEIHPTLGTAFPGVICASVNEEIVHGIPSDRKLESGDIVSIDIGAIYQGFHADAARTVAVGKITSQVRRLLEVTEEALRRGIEKVRPGARLYEISAAIDQYASVKGMGIVRQYVGHGIGRTMHEPPQIPNHRMDTPGPPLQPGWALAIEPMLNLGTEKTRVLDDGWTVVTADGAPSAHFEHTVAVTPKGRWILTLPDDAAA